MKGAAGFTREHVLARVEPLVFGRRLLLLGLLGAATVVLAWLAAGTRLDTGFEESLPLAHPYMQVLRQYQDDFGGANTLLVALIQQDKTRDLYNEHFLARLRKITDEVMLLPGVERARVSSLFTPDVRYSEVVEGGYAGGSVIPAEYQPTPFYFDLARANAVKGGHVGRYTTSDQTGAMVFAELQPVDPLSGSKPDYRAIAAQLANLRTAHGGDGIDIHVLGFAALVGEMAEAAGEIAGFFLIALLLVGGLLAAYLGSARLALVPLACALVAATWQIGLLRASGAGLDPFAMLVPFLVLTVSLSHGVPYTSAWAHELAIGKNGFDASLHTFRHFAGSGSVILLASAGACLALLLVPIDLVREMVRRVLGGLFAVFVTTQLLLPLWLSYLNVRDVDAFARKQARREALLEPLFRALAIASRPLPAAAIILAVAALFGASLWHAGQLRFGTATGAAELRPGGRYNQDALAIAANFSSGADLLRVIAETDPESCTRHEAMEQIDRFGWHMRNTPGVRSVLSLPVLSREVNAAFAQGAPKFRVLPRNQSLIVQSITPIPTSSGLLNPDCSAMAVLLYASDREGRAIERIAAAAQRFNTANADAWFAANPGASALVCRQKIQARRAWTDARVRLRQHFAQLRAQGLGDGAIAANPPAIALRQSLDSARERFDAMNQSCPVNFALASGPLAAVAATQQVLRAWQLPIIAAVCVVLLLVLGLAARSLRAALCIVAPLFVVAVSIPAMMAHWGIGMSAALFPVAALGLAMGAGPGYFLYATMAAPLQDGMNFDAAYGRSLRTTGKALLFCGVALAAAAAAWIGSSLQFQADLGRLLAFSVGANLVAALVVCPALCRYFLKLPQG